MKASEIKPGMRNIDLELKIIEMDEPREFDTEKGQGKVATAVGKDDSGKVKISFWDEEIDRIEEEDTVEIQSGYSRLFKDEVHVSVGRYGDLEVLSDSEKS